MTPMGKRRPGIGILPLLMIVFLCISWLTALNRQDEMTYDQMVQLFEQQKVESFQFTDSSTLVMQLHDGSTARCRIHDYTLFYNDLNDLVKDECPGAGRHGAGPHGKIRLRTNQNAERSG